METVIELDRPLDCRHCRGTGLAAGSGYQECPDCQGRGRRYGGPGPAALRALCATAAGGGAESSPSPASIASGAGGHSERQEYRLRIPPGTEDGARLRFDGEGGDGFQKRPAGRTWKWSSTWPRDDFFTRVGNDIHCRVKVSFAEAALGGIIRIPTLDGYQTFDLPQGTQTGWIFRFPGPGPPAAPTNRRATR